MAATDRTLRLEQQLAAQIRQISDADVQTLVAAWARAWDDIEIDLVQSLEPMLIAGQNISAGQLRRSVRLQKALRLALARLTTLSTLVDRTTLASLQRVIDVTGGAQASIIDSQLPASAHQLVDLDAWSRVDPRQVDAIVARSTQQITSATRPLPVYASQVMRRELVRGVVVGSNPRETARRMVARAGDGFMGGLNRAMTIARTETLDAHRAAAQLGQAQHADVLAGWEWVASLGPRTCPACWGMNGTRHALDDPGPLGHQNCRCSRVPVTRPWRELGIDLDEPRSLLPDTRAAFAAMSKAEQVQVLGPRRWAAWNAGKFPPEVWAARRTTKGWRDSYVPAKPPKSKTPAGHGSSAKPPRPPASEPPAAVDDWDMGPVLGSPAQQRYHRPPDVAPHPSQLRADSAEFWHTYIPNAEDRTTALLMNQAWLADPVRMIARETGLGLPRSAETERAISRAWDRILDPVDGDGSGATGDNYPYSALLLDLEGAARRLLAREETQLPTVYRGLGLNIDRDLIYSIPGRRRLAGLVRATGWFAESTTSAADLAEMYARVRGGAGIMLRIEGAKGIDLTPVGRFAGRHPESLVTGSLDLDWSASYVENGVLIVPAEWREELR